ncbi:MAG: tetratricopeptide repeat protein [Bacteroidota bacterium]|jgi:tetratricopeptide (TPR) repeat protein
MPTSITKYRQVSASVFELLVQLIRSQQQEEIRIIRRYITMMKDEENSKLAELFDFIEIRPTIPSDELKNLCSTIFGRSLQQRASDLFNVLVHAMNTHYYTNRPNRFSERTRERNRLKSWLNCADFIWQRNDTVALFLLDRAASQSEGLELYSEWQRALVLIRDHASQRLTSEELEPISLEIKNARDGEDAVTLARMLMQEAAHRGRRISSEVSTEWHTEAINKLLEEENKTKSVTVAYNRMLIQADAYQRKHQYSKASVILKNVYELVMNSAALKMPHLIQLTQLNQADNLMRDGQFDSAYSLVKSVAKNIAGEGINWLQARKIEAEALFFLEDYTESRNILIQLINHSNGRWGDQADEMMLGVASAYFAEGNYKESLKAIQEITVLPRRNKSGFNLGVRTLRCMNLIMLNKFDDLCDDLERDQKYLQRLTGTHHIRNRDVVIMKTLLGFAGSGINFKRVAELKSTLLQQLAQGSDDCIWYPLTHEWIVFDQWFAAAAKGENYRFVMPEYLQNQAVG